MESAAKYKALGNAAFTEKRFEEAIDMFNKAIEFTPEDHILFSNKSACYASLEKYQEALDAAEECIRLNSKFIKGYSRKALALYKMQRVEDALKTIDDGLGIDPSNEQLIKDRNSMIERNNGSMDGLLGLLQDPNIQKLMKENPQLFQQLASNPQFMQQLFSNSKFRGPAHAATDKSFMEEHKCADNCGHTHNPQSQAKATSESSEIAQFDNLKKEADELYKKKLFDEAIEKYEECAALNTKNVLVLNNKAACLIEQGKYVAAHETINTAIARFRDLEYSDKNPAHLSKLLGRRARIHKLQGNILEAIKAYEDALLEDANRGFEDELKELRKIKLQKEKEAYINPALADEHREKGNEFFNKGDFGKALSEYEEASKRNPEDPRVYNNKASCFIKIMKYQQALSEVETALRIDPNFVKALLRKGTIHQFLKEFHKAIEAYEKVLKIDPENKDAQKGIVATNAQIAQSMHGQNDEERLQRAMADPEIAAIVSDPMVRIALEQMQQNPRNIQEYMQDSALGPKISKLIQAGIIRTS